MTVTGLLAQRHWQRLFFFAWTSGEMSEISEMRSPISSYAYFGTAKRAK
jgi:hypothetical protein